MHRKGTFDTHQMLTGMSCVLVSFLPFCVSNASKFLILGLIVLTLSIAGYIYSFFREIADNKPSRQKINKSSYFFIVTVFSMLSSVVWNAINQLDQAQRFVIYWFGLLILVLNVICWIRGDYVTTQSSRWAKLGAFVYIVALIQLIELYLYQHFASQQDLLIKKVVYIKMFFLLANFTIVLSSVIQRNLAQKKYDEWQKKQSEVQSAKEK